VALWNLVQLANALAPLTGEAAALEAGLEGYAETFSAGHRTMIAAKLGLRAPDEALGDELFERVLPAVETDMTLFFRGLADVGPEASDLLAPVQEAFYAPLEGAARETVTGWLGKYAARVREEADPERRARMTAVNPRYVLRNYIAQLAIDDAEAGKFSTVGELLELLRRPYDEQPGREEWARKRPEWARNRAGCSMLSCSS
jgi:uncharacterized protein YdiU (UPF0061 family)